MVLVQGSCWRPLVPVPFLVTGPGSRLRNLEAGFKCQTLTQLFEGMELTLDFDWLL